MLLEMPPDVDKKHYAEFYSSSGAYDALQLSLGGDVGFLVGDKPGTSDLGQKDRMYGHNSSKRVNRMVSMFKRLGTCRYIPRYSSVPDIVSMASGSSRTYLHR